MRSSQKDVAKDADTYKPVVFDDKDLLAKVKLSQSGHMLLSDGRLAVWSRLAAIPWTYLVVAPEAKLLADASN